jgi:glycosyltransferase involved in cell wall biosynthesis
MADEVSALVPLISVIVPVFNGAQFLQAAIESVLTQSVKELEILIVDDGSEDHSLEIAGSFSDPRISMLHQRRSGPAAARNNGLRSGRGKFFAFVDADDIWPPGKLAWQIDHLHGSSRVGISLGAVQHFVGDPMNPVGGLLKSYQFGAAVIRRELIDQIGLLDESLQLGEDLDWFMRAKDMGMAPYYKHETALYYRVQNSGSLTHGKDLQARQVFNVIHKALLRRRNGIKETRGHVDGSE